MFKMLKRNEFKLKFVLMFCIICTTGLFNYPTVVYAQRKAFYSGPIEGSTYNHPDDYYETEDAKLKRLKEKGSKDDYYVNYYTIREMSFNENLYDSSLLLKKYETMNKWIRFPEGIEHHAFDKEKSLMVYKIGIIDKIWKADTGEIFFTLEDNPLKKFYVLPCSNSFFMPDITEKSDIIFITATQNRVVYSFDNLTLQRNLRGLCGGENSFIKFNTDHPEDMVIDGYFPNKLYSQRLDSHHISKPDWLNLFLEYVDEDLENYFGLSATDDFVLNPEKFPAVEEYLSANETFNAVAEEMKYDVLVSDDYRCRQNSYGFDYSNIEGYICSTGAYVKDIEILPSGETIFTTWESPTRRFYLSKEYDPLNLSRITKPGDIIYIYYDQNRNVYLFDNNSFQDLQVFTSYNNPDFVASCDEKQEVKRYAKFPNTLFWSRVNELTVEEKKFYQELGLKNSSENED